MEFKPHLIRWEEVKEESLSGKQMIYDVEDKAGRPIVLMRPRCGPPGTGVPLGTAQGAVYMYSALSGVPA